VIPACLALAVSLGSGNLLAQETVMGERPHETTGLRYARTSVRAAALINGVLILIA